MKSKMVSVLAIFAMATVTLVGTMALSSGTASAGGACIGAGQTNNGNLSCIGWGKTNSGRECIGQLHENDSDGDDCEGIDP